MLHELLVLALLQHLAPIRRVKGHIAQPQRLLKVERREGVARSRDFLKYRVSWHANRLSFASCNSHIIRRHLRVA